MKNRFQQTAPKKLQQFAGIDPVILRTRRKQKIMIRIADDDLIYMVIITPPRATVKPCFPRRSEPFYPLMI
jgi:hypothetical protein